MNNPNVLSPDAAPAASPKPRRPRASKVDTLNAFHDRIVAWRAQGLDLRAIAAQVNALGGPVRIDHNVVNRYCTRHGIAAAKPTSSEPPTDDSAEEAWSLEELAARLRSI